MSRHRLIEDVGPFRQWPLAFLLLCSLALFEWVAPSTSDSTTDTPHSTTGFERPVWGGLKNECFSRIKRAHSDDLDSFGEGDLFWCTLSNEVFETLASLHRPRASVTSHVAASPRYILPTPRAPPSA